VAVIESGDPLQMAFLKRTRSTSKSIRAHAERSARIDDCVASHIEADGPGLALAVVAYGTVVHATAYGLADARNGLPVEQDTIFHLASCGKQFTGLGILMLAEERKLDLDDPVGKHIPFVAGFGPRVTIRKLLHHTSGIRDLYDEDGVKQLLACCERPTNSDVIRTYADLGCPMAEEGIEPGDTFSYSNSGYELLGAVIEEASSQSYHDFFARRVFERLKMKDTFSAPDRTIDGLRCATGYTLDERGGLMEASSSELDSLVGSGSFYTTASDLCLYDQALRANSVVNEASTAQAFTGGQTNDSNPTNYGFGWYLGAQDGISFADHEGAWNGFRSYICYCLDRPLSIFVLSNHPEVDLLEVANVATDACR
jgi:CubicO group peptidase (beta-lactamase class C family)